jgi:hypothetical protein
MAGYDPKRGRPATDAPDDEPAPVDALLGDVPVTPPAAVGTPNPTDADVTVDVTDAARSEAAAPEPKPTATTEPAASTPEPPIVPEPPSATPPPVVSRPSPPPAVPPAPDQPSSRVAMIAGVAAATLAALVVFRLRRRRR